MEVKDMKSIIKDLDDEVNIEVNSGRKERQNYRYDKYSRNAVFIVFFCALVCNKM